MGGTKKNSNLYRAKIVYNKAIDVAENYNLEISYYHTIQPVFFWELLYSSLAISKTYITTYTFRTGNCACVFWFY